MIEMFIIAPREEAAMSEGDFRFDRELIEAQKYSIGFGDDSPLVMVTPELEQALRIVIEACARTLTSPEILAPRFYGASESDIRLAIGLIATAPQLGNAIDGRIQKLTNRTYRVMPKYDTYEGNNTPHLGGFWRELSGIRHGPLIFWTNDPYNLLSI